MGLFSRASRTVSFVVAGNFLCRVFEKFAITKRWQETKKILVCRWNKNSIYPHSLQKASCILYMWDTLKWYCHVTLFSPLFSPVRFRPREEDSFFSASPAPLPTLRHLLLLPLPNLHQPTEPVCLGSGGLNSFFSSFSLPKCDVLWGDDDSGQQQQQQNMRPLPACSSCAHPSWGLFALLHSFYTDLSIIVPFADFWMCS